MHATRSREQLREHFEVERELAARLRASTRAERTALYGVLYQELFERVPHHPRLTRRDTPEASRRSVAVRMRLLEHVLTPETRFLEFAPGDCRLAYEVAKRVRTVVAADISDQRAQDDTAPANFDLVVYDGYSLDLEPNSVDVAFSYQFLEHLHPEDVDAHMEMAARLLRPGGVYVFDTPHRYSGPHDVSRFFGDTLECFHFQEWTFREMRILLERHGFARCTALRRGTALESRWANAAHEGVERAVGMLPRRLRKAVSDRLFQSVSMVATRGDHP